MYLFSPECAVTAQIEVVSHVMNIYSRVIVTLSLFVPSGVFGQIGSLVIKLLASQARGTGSIFLLATKRV